MLLDEFEKAAEPIWDVFLQVFDDGRLTDSHGRLADFRRCVIILTSNVGSAIAGGPGVGFDPGEAGFSETAAERALRTTFRPELLNRIDRVVMFRPFERSAMRSLLDKELAAALARRGLRERPWAVEVDESATTFLIDKGFSPALGARPLKRAIEQHLLVPLASAIVEQSVPDGDQFLFVSAPGGTEIAVTFVDPDAEDEAVREEPTTELDVRTLARAGRGDEQSVRFVLDEMRRVAAAVAALDPVKAGALAALAEPAFWETPGRFAVLAKAEYLDRLQAATRTAERPGGEARAEHARGQRKRRARPAARGPPRRARERARAESPQPTRSSCSSTCTRRGRRRRVVRRHDRRDVRRLGAPARHAGRAPLVARAAATCSPCRASAAGGSSTRRRACTSSRTARAPPRALARSIARPRA